MVTEEDIRQALKSVIDPELGINMVDLGLLYNVEFQMIDDKVESVKVTMTLTTPGCPLGGWFVEQIKATVAPAAQVDEEQVRIEVVFDPPWTYDMIAEEAQAELGL